MHQRSFPELYRFVLLLQNPVHNLLVQLEQQQMADLL